MHPRNRHQGTYDFAALVRACPELARHLRRNPEGEATVDFADPAAVRTLNATLLASQYGIRGWRLPPDYLCPPVPGRADHVHALADLLAAGGPVPRGPEVRVLDVGVGASAIYPLLGAVDYGWSFVGADVDAGALASAAAILEANPGLPVELRRQADSRRIFEGVVRPGERFALSLCNPPFHASAREARAGTQRKWRNLGQGGGLNFGGRQAELWCEGGETGFLTRMIRESAARPELCGWFTALVAKSEHLPRLRAALRAAQVCDSRVLEISHGQKRSRILAWRF